jgi:bacterioferritin (cytochrome b1)
MIRPMESGGDLGAVRSRKDFLRLAGVLAAPAGVLAACGGGGGERSKKLSPAEVDFRLMNRILGLELAGIAAYEQGLPLLRGGARATARRFLSQEREHAAFLARRVSDLGGTPNEPKTAAEYRRSFPALRDQPDVLRFAFDLENRVVRAYVEFIPKMSSPELRAAAGSIVATEAEHISVLLGERHLPQVPSAFVTGTAEIG